MAAAKAASVESVIEEPVIEKDRLTELIEMDLERGVPVMAASNAAVGRAEERRRKLLETYKAEKKVPTYLDPSFAAWLGNITQVQVNGISLAVPINGDRVELPETFADVLESKRRAINDITNKMKNMSNASSNVETSPGELQFF